MTDDVAMVLQRSCYWVMRGLRRLGLAWWPEGSRVGITDIGRRPPTTAEIATALARSESELRALYMRPGTMVTMDPAEPSAELGPTQEQIDAVLRRMDITLEVLLKQQSDDSSRRRMEQKP